MSQYRDDQEAARHRLESLEETLAARDAELEQHKNEIAERDREISRLARELRSAGTARIIAPRRAAGMRFMVAGAMSAAIMVGMIGFLSVHRTAVVAPTVTFADFPPPTMPLAAPRLDNRSLATTPGDEALDKALKKELAEAMREHDQESQANERRAPDALKLKAWAGKASIDEVRSLVQRCMRQGDEECVERADEIRKTLEPNKPL